MPVKPIPEGHHTVTPLLSVKGAARLIEFFKKAFGATEIYSFPAPDGAVMHAELKIGDSLVMLGEAMKDPPTSATYYVYVQDADATYRAALSAGGESLEAPDRSVLGRPGGHHQRLCRKQVDDRHPRGGRKRRTRKASPEAHGRLICLTLMPASHSIKAANHRTTGLPPFAREGNPRNSRSALNYGL